MSSPSPSQNSPNAHHGASPLPRRRRRRLRLFSLLVAGTVLLAAACSSEPTGYQPDDDAGVEDAGESDAKSDDIDSGESDDTGADADADTGPPPPPQIDHFDIEPDELGQGDSFSVSWESTDADTCTAGGDFPDWSGDVDTAGTEPFDADVDLGDYELTLHCENDTDTTAFEARTLTVIDPCEQRTLLSDVSGWSLASEVVGGDRSSDPSQYTSVFVGDEFPGTKNSFDFYLPKYEYAAMEFTVPEDMGIADGLWRLEGSYHPDSGAGLLFLTISECPADFKYDNFEDKRCTSVFESGAGQHTTRWTTDPEDDYHLHCHIEPGETYYLNALYVENLEDVEIEDIREHWPPTQSDCAGWPRCASLLQAAGG